MQWEENAWLCIVLQLSISHLNLLWGQIVLIYDTHEVIFLDG